MSDSEINKLNAQTQLKAEAILKKARAEKGGPPKGFKQTKPYEHGDGIGVITGTVDGQEGYYDELLGFFIPT